MVEGPGAHVVGGRQVEDHRRRARGKMSSGELIAQGELSRIESGVGPQRCVIERRGARDRSRGEAREREHALDRVCVPGHRRSCIVDHESCDRLAPVLAGEPDAPRRAGGEHGAGALRVALGVHGHLGREAAELPRESQPCGDTAPTTELEHRVQPGKVGEKPGELGLDDPADPRVGENGAQSVEDG